MEEAEFEIMRRALQDKGEVFLQVKVQPKSGKSEIVGLMEDGETLKLKLKAAPEKGRANEEACDLLSEEFGVRRGNVFVISGQTARLKLIKITK